MHTGIPMRVLFMMSMALLIVWNINGLAAETPPKCEDLGLSEECAVLCKKLDDPTQIDALTFSDLLKLVACNGLDDKRIQSASKFAAIRKEQEEQNEGVRKFAGIQFGVGLSLTIDVGKNNRVQDAELVGTPGNQVVRVKKESKAIARVMLETHYFFTPCLNKLRALVPVRDPDGTITMKERLVDRAGNPITKPGEYVCGRYLGLEQGQFGVGPFISVQPGTDEIIEAIGGGVMVGLRRKQGLGSFNIGVGFVVDPNVRVLGADIKENQRLPADETQIRFREKTQGGILVMGSFSW